MRKLTNCRLDLFVHFALIFLAINAGLATLPAACGASSNARYTVKSNGDLQYYIDRGAASSAHRWETTAAKISNGWNFAEVSGELLSSTAVVAGARPVASGGGGNQPPRGKGYRTSEWSPWSRSSGVQYRYRWGWDPADARYSKHVDAIFEMRNLQRAVWTGAARSLDCNQNTLSMSMDVRLQPNETRQVKFRTPNCGTLQSPRFQANIVRAGKFDR